MHKNLISIFLFAIVFSLTGYSQDTTLPRCGVYEAQEAYFEKHPERREQALKLEEKLNAFSKKFHAANKLTPDTAIIPVVFHVIHNNGTENISDQDIFDAIAQLNEDYNANNSDLSYVISEFDDIIGNAQIEFRLAQYDPDGNCTNGITRTVSDLTYTGGDAIKALVQWPSNSYLNIWTSKVALSSAGSVGEVLGYATFPYTSEFNPDEDGLVIDADYIGTGFRIITHEAGHWLNLRHTWGNIEVETSCLGDDLVADTPDTQGNFGGCNTAAISCGSLDNVQNFMDYAIPCYRMFTEGQATRMVSTLNSSIADRNQLWTTSNLNATGVLLDPILCTADFEANDVRICTGSSVQFTNKSYSGDTEWSWVFEGGTPSTSTEENPVVVYNTTGEFQVSLTAGNGVDEETEIKDQFISVLEDVGISTPVEEGFENATEFPNDEWVVYSTDTERYWEVTSAASSSGSKSAVLKNYYQSDQYEDILESNPIDLSGLESLVVTFKYAYAKRHDDDDDILRFKVTKTCGNSWSTKETLRATNNTLVTAPNHLGYFTPESDEWDEAYIDDISDLYLIENFRLRFEFKAGEGNNVYIDDINLYDPTTVGVNEVNKAALNYQVYPNPIENSLNISFNLLHNTDVSGEVFDISGRKVSTLFDTSFPVGVNSTNINTSDWRAGIYFVRISLEGETFIEKVIKK